jgi:hypothetical protein
VQPVKPPPASGIAPAYRSALAGVGGELRPTLRALERLAADPHLLEGDDELLAGLRYALDASSERVLALVPSAGLEEAHDELELALAIARDETAGVAEALDEHGEGGADDLLWEWRVALFGVRLALLRLDGGAAPDAAAPLSAALLPIALLAVGVAGVLGGALAGLWLLWVPGLLVVGVSAGLSHRRP